MVENMSPNVNKYPIEDLRETISHLKIENKRLRDERLHYFNAIDKAMTWWTSCSLTCDGRNAGSILTEALIKYDPPQVKDK